MERVVLAMQVWNRSRRGWAQVEMGRLALGIADLEEGLRRARELGQWDIASWTHMARAIADEYAGNSGDTAFRHARESLEYAQRAGSPFTHASGFGVRFCLRASIWGWE
jgi:hypothetical protein